MGAAVGATLPRTVGRGQGEPVQREVGDCWYDNLSPREQDVVPLMAQGLTDKRIANNLNISPSTVKKHVHNILRKANVDSRVLVVKHYQLHLMSSPYPS